jgi:hypothetical protein
MTAFEQAVSIISDGNQTHFAKKVSDEVDKINKVRALKKPIPRLSQQLVNYYLKNDVVCAAYYVPIIAKLTGGKVSMSDLRPDVYPEQAA